MKLCLHPSNGYVDTPEYVKCMIPNCNQTFDYIWVKWGDSHKQKPITIGPNQIVIERPNGLPNQEVEVQVYSFDTPITDIAIYVYLDRGNYVSIFNFKKNRKQ